MTSRATPRVRHVDVTTWAEPGVRGRRPAQCFREGRSALHRLGVGGRTRRLCVGSSGGGRRCPHSRLIFTCYPKNGSISSIAVDITVGRFWARPFAGSAPTPKRRCLHANVVRFFFSFFPLGKVVLRVDAALLQPASLLGVMSVLFFLHDFLGSKLCLGLPFFSFSRTNLSSFFAFIHCFAK